MVDYYKIVQRFVAALGPNTEATRQALYERARAGLAKQLLLQNPPAPSDSIRAEFAALEEAIEKTESEARSAQYEVKDKKKAAKAAKEPAPAKRTAVFQLIWSALLLVAGAAYFISWMRYSDSGGSIATALALLLVFTLPAALVFIFAIYPILSPLLWLLRWLNKKALRRLVGADVLANAAGATLLSAVLCAIGAFSAPGSFSWWAAGWCWLGCVFLLTLDPEVVVNLRAWLHRVQRRKAARPDNGKTPVNAGTSATGIDQQAEGALTEKEALKNVA